MKTVTYRRKQKHGFSLIEILAVVTIIALLLAILIPVTSKVLASARINAALSEIRTLRTLVGDAASRLGGTLPLTEGIDNQSSVTFDATLTARLPVNNALSTFTDLTTLDSVLMSLNPPMMEANFTASLGTPFLANPNFPQIAYNPGTNSFSAPTFARNPNYRYVSDFNTRLGGRVECALVSTFFDVTTTRGRLVNRQANENYDAVLAQTRIDDPDNQPTKAAPSGVNFTLDGVNFLPAGSRCVFIIYEKVPIADAYTLSKQLNAPSLMNSSRFNVNAQPRGRVVYAGNPVATTVYVYLVHF